MDIELGICELNARPMSYLCVYCRYGDILHLSKVKIIELLGLAC